MHFNESLIVLILSVPFVLVILSILDLMKRNFSGPSDKILWIFLIILIPVLGPLLYFIIGRRSSSRNPSSFSR